MTQGDATTRASYQLYFTSGLYDQRYPSPNRTMWRRIEAFLTPETSVLDFGCGSGRYLLRLRGLVGRAIGFDVSPAALETIRARSEGWDELLILGPEAADLDTHIEHAGRVDVALCLFGVLGHITDAQARMDALMRIRRALKPGTGRLLISVPNGLRRFRTAQRQAAQGGPDGLVCYERRTGDGTSVVLNYQLFDPELLVRELAEAGFDLRRLGCESMLPESWLLHHAALRWIDGLITPFCPARWGYGIYAEASC